MSPVVQRREILSLTILLTSQSYTSHWCTRIRRSSPSRFVVGLDFVSEAYWWQGLPHSRNILFLDPNPCRIRHLFLSFLCLCLCLYRACLIFLPSRLLPNCHLQDGICVCLCLCIFPCLFSFLFLFLSSSTHQGQTLVRHIVLLFRMHVRVS